MLLIENRLLSLLPLDISQHDKQEHESMQGELLNSSSTIIVKYVDEHIQDLGQAH